MKRCIHLLWVLLLGSCCPVHPKPPSATPPATASVAPAPAASASATAVTASPPLLGPPLAHRGSQTDVIFGQRVSDPYRWLEDETSEPTKRWTAAIDGYSRSYLNGLPGRVALTKRITELSYLDWISAPRRRGKRYFYSQRHKDREKVVYYWREGKTGKARLLLDPNTMSADGSVSVRGVAPSYDGRWVAYKVSENNADEATLKVMDVASGKLSAIDTIAGAKYARPSWDPNGRGFYYTRLPTDPAIKTAERPGHAEIYYHRLGTDPKRDRRIVEKTGDPKVFIGANVSRDGRFLFYTKMYGWTKNDLFFRDLRRDKEFRPFAVGLDAKFHAYAWRGKIYVLTNLDAPRWRLFKVDPKRPERADWREIVPQHPTAVLDSFSVVGEHLMLSYLDKASSRLRVTDLEGKHSRKITLPGIGSVHGVLGNPDDDEAYFAFSSFTTPLTIFELSVSKGQPREYFKVDAPVDPKPYRVEQVWYRSKDGTRVSMFIVAPKAMKTDGSTPLLLTGYGGFNISKTPGFRATWFAWLEKGGAIALANLRGGGEYGEAWHRGGMRLQKQNTFDDFIAAAKYLIDQKYTRPDRLAIQGGSNGGLLVGAAMTQRPELFAAVICAVPLLDMVRYHRFGSGKTWISEYGSADDEAQFRALYAYSPYHHVGSGVRYPALLTLGADSDDRVDPMHARKFTAAVRRASKSGRRVLLRVEAKAGHGGGDMIKKRVARAVDVYAFLFEELAMN